MPRTAFLLLAMLVVVSFFSPCEAALTPADDLSNIPHIDKLVYKVLTNEDQRVLALQAGETEMQFGYVDPVHLPALNADPDLAVSYSNRSGYHVVAFNCRKYPLNESVLRRSFALAFDKEKAATEIWDGLAMPYDSFLPPPSTWCPENLLPHHYYSADVESGNNLLDSNGFIIDPLTGFRNSPNGDSFSVTIRCDFSLETHHQVALLSAEALTSLHINSSLVPLDFIPEFYAANFADPLTAFDMVIAEIEVESERVDWIANSYSSSGVSHTGVSLTGFSNTTFDSHAEIVLNEQLEASYDDAIAMQIVLHQNVPAMVVCQERRIEVYRTDWYEGQVHDVLGRIHNRVTLTEMHRGDGSIGGVVPIGIDMAPVSQSFNPFLSTSEFGRSMIELIFPSMFKTGLALGPEPHTALSVTKSTHSDTDSIPEGHAAYTVSLASLHWQDESPVCSLDFVYTLGTLMNFSQLPADLWWVANVVGAWVIDSTHFRVEFSTDSPWNIIDLGFLPIIRNGTLQNRTIADWDPYIAEYPSTMADFPQNAGSFFFSDYEDGEFYEFTSAAYSGSSGITLGSWNGRTLSPTIDTPSASGVVSLGVEQQVFLGSVVGCSSCVLLALFISKRRESKFASDDALRAITLGVICSFLVIMPIGSFVHSVSHPLSWGVAPGDSFQMEVCFRGFSGGQTTPFAFEYAQLEGLIITVEILELNPVAQGVLTASSLESLREQNKVQLSCETSSPLIDDLLDLFEYYVSAALLPIGDWTNIDDAVDFSGLEFGARSYYACEVDDIFLYGYHSFNIDAGSGWQANVSLTNGFPEVVQLWSCSYHPPYVYYRYSLALQLV